MKIVPVASSSVLLLSQDPGGNVEDYGLDCSQQHAGASDWAYWAKVVRQAQNGSAYAESELCHFLLGSLRSYFCRQRRSYDAEDLAHEALLIVLQAIRNKELHEPERLMGFVRVIAFRTLCATFKSDKRQCRCGSEELTDTVIDKTCNPESAVLTDERAAMLREGLQALPELDRIILTRFYLRRQSRETICEALDLSETQFRLRKSRAKARLGKLSRRISGRRQLTLRASGPQQ
jgi:RNA polymerase sigma factor (sigma-70 family)